MMKKIYKIKNTYTLHRPPEINPTEIIEIIKISTNLIEIFSEFLGIIKKKVPSSIFIDEVRYGYYMHYQEDNIIEVGYVSEEGETKFQRAGKNERQAKRYLYQLLKESLIV